MALLKDFINLILYGNFWIALAASTMVLQTQWLWHSPPYYSALTGLLFFATLFLYALHRIVGISRLKDFLEEERYAVIYRYRHHIRVYAILGLLGALCCFWWIPWAIRLELLLPGLLSLAYVWPIFAGRRRLRDINHLKIFLIALVWSWVTVRLPFVEAGRSTFSPAQALMLLERALFVFAITLPFDIRDLEVDRYSQVKTIPSMLGVERSVYLAYACLGSALLLAWIQVDYSPAYHWGLSLSYLSTALLLYWSRSYRHDYYYTGLLDGTMIFQWLWILLCDQFL